MTDATAGDSPRTVARSPDRRQLLKGLSAGSAVALAGCAALQPDAAASRLDADLGPGDATDFGGAMRFGERYAMTVTQDGAGEVAMTGRFHGTDRYLRFERAEGPVESYLVDGAVYVVTADGCRVYPEAGVGVESVETVDEAAIDDVPSDDLRVTGTSRIEGTPVLVLERPPDATADAAPAVTYYVHRETRYLRRLETPDAVVDYADWGAVEPIEPPDVDCRRPE